MNILNPYARKLRMLERLESIKKDRLEDNRGKKNKKNPKTNTITGNLSRELSKKEFLNARRWQNIFTSSMKQIGTNSMTVSSF